MQDRTRPPLFSFLLVLSLLLSAATALAQDPYEPNDTFGTATGLDCGLRPTGSSISPSDDRDIFTFALTETSLVRFDIDAQVLGSDLNSQIALYNSSGSRLAGNDNAAAPGEPESFDSYLELELGPGTYFLEVASSIGPFGAGARGFYDLRITAEGGCVPYSAPGSMVGLGGKCLDVFRSMTDDGSRVVFWECHGGANQRWRFRDAGAFLRLEGLAGKCLQPGPLHSSGNRSLVIGPCGGSDDRWQLAGLFPRDFRFVHVDSGLCLDVFGMNTADGTPILTFGCHGGANQRWRFQPTNTGAACQPSATTMCLNQGRFRVEVDWRRPNGIVGQGRQAPVSSPDSGIFYFFDPDNWEMLVKVLDGCGNNDHYWVFFAATTNVEFTLTVTDTEADV